MRKLNEMKCLIEKKICRTVNERAKLKEMYREKKKMNNRKGIFLH